MKTILHLRIDSLFARVEQIRNPELDGKPVVVGKNAGNSSGIVVSASSEARGLGVVEGLTIRHAQRLCPDGVFIRANFALYREYAHQAFDILASYSPLVEPQSLERVFVDVTGSRNLFGGAKGIAEEAVRKIRERTGLEVAVGIASSKFTAEAAAYTVAPGEIREVAAGGEKAFLSPLPVKLIRGIGEKTERRLEGLRIRTIGQLSMIPERLLVRQFGQIGSSFHRLSNGLDFSPVTPAYPFEIIKTEHMFENEVEEPDEVRAYLPQIADRLALELRKRERLAEHITLKLYLAGSTEPVPPLFRRGIGGGCTEPSRYITVSETSIQPHPNPLLRGEGVTSPSPCRRGGAGGEVVRSDGATDNYEISAYRLKHPVNSAREIASAANRLLGIVMRPGIEVIGLEIMLSDLAMGEGIQLDLLGEGENRKKLDAALETIKDRFGEKSIFYAAALAVSGRETVLARVAA